MAEEKPLTLTDAFTKALSNNLNLNIQRLNPVSAALDVNIAKATLYNPTFTQGLSTAGDANIDTYTQDGSSKISQKLPIGGTVDLVWNYYRTSTLESSPTYKSASGFTLSMPLLANFGWDVTIAPIVISGKQLNVSRLALREGIEKLIADVNSAYWSLKMSLEELIISRENYEDAKKVHERTLELIKEGNLAELEKYQTEAAISTREDSLLTKEKEAKDNKDTLLNLLRLDLSEEIVPVDSPNFRRLDPNYEEVMENSFKYRPDYLTALENLEISEWNLKVARSSSLPDLSFSGGYTTGSNYNPGGFTQGAMSRMDQTRNWTGGLNFSVPFPNTAKKDAYYKSKISNQQSRITLAQLKDTIAKELKQTIRALETAQKKVEVSKNARELAEKKLEAEMIKLDEGLSDNFMVITFQNDLSTARSAENKAITDYQITAIALKKSEGTLLKYLNISFEDELEKEKALYKKIRE
ncbi:MAG: TolC family protein [Proteobacteria bacterium]|nr:TolC family protein [Pseudomonadota bacterium]